MNTRLWHYLMNSILIATAGSYRAMRVIANFTLDALNRPLDTFLYGLYTNLLPFVSTFITAYDIWVSQLGSQISTTSSFYVALETLRSTDIKKWDIAIQQVYMKGSDGYKALLPHGRKPFQSGSQEDRLAAVAALGIALFGIVSLGAVLTLVNAKLVVLNNAKSSKNTGKSTTGSDSGDVESARVTLGQELYGVLGNLMYHFRANPVLIIPFFDIQTIRKMEQTIWDRTLKTLAKVYVFTRTLVATDNLKFVNNSMNTIRFAFVLNKTDAIGLIYVDVPPMSGVTVARSTMGSLLNLNMVVQNMGTGTAKYMIVII